MPEFREGDVIVQIEMSDMWVVDAVCVRSHDYYLTRFGHGFGGLRLLWEDADENYVKVGNVDDGDWSWWNTSLKWMT